MCLVKKIDSTLTLWSTLGSSCGAMHRAPIGLCACYIACSSFLGLSAISYHIPQLFRAVFICSNTCDLFHRTEIGPSDMIHHYITVLIFMDL